MDIYTAKNAIERLLAYVESIADEDKRMYRPSVERFHEIASTCQRVSEVISVMLQRNAIESCDKTEFGDRDSAALLLPSAMSQRSALGIHNTPNQIVIQNYRAALNQLCAPAIYPRACDLVDILKAWFHTRFIAVHNVSSKFHYNVNQIGNWIASFVCVYGHSIEMGTSADVISRWRSWCSDLPKSAGIDLYAVPYDVHCFSRHRPANQLTLTSVVLFDLLLDGGLDMVTSATQQSDIYLDSEYIYKLCANQTPEILDKYRHYTVDATICNNLKGGTKRA